MQSNGLRTSCNARFWSSVPLWLAMHGLKLAARSSDQNGTQYSEFFSLSGSDLS